MERQVPVGQRRKSHPRRKAVTVAATVLLLLDDVHLPTEDASRHPPMVPPCGGRSPEPPPAGERLDSHRTLHVDEIFGTRQALHAHRFLEMTDFDRNPVGKTVPDEHILQLHLVVREIEVELAEPFLIKRGLDCEPGPPYRHAVAETERPVVVLEVLVGLGHQSGDILRGEIGGRIHIDAVVEPESERPVARLERQFAIAKRSAGRHILLCETCEARKSGPYHQ